jgi:hypothetical protein
MLKKTWMSFFLVVVGFVQSGFAQEDRCSKPRVAVQAQFSYEKELIEYLGETYPSQPRASWLERIRESVLAELRMNSPDIPFIPAEEGGAADCDYEFRYGVVPYGDGLQMDSNLAQKDACGFPGNLLQTINRKDSDVFRMIERNIDAYGSISQRIREFESSHRVPPRGPEMDISLRKEFVSPIKEEREMEIQIGVKNCKGEAVYDPNHGQKVILPRHTERGELICTKGFPQICRSFDATLLLEITSPAGASATYRLKKGMEASEDPLKIKTCGMDREVWKQVSVPIYGMQIEAEAKDPVISPGENTTIEVSLHKITLQGQMIPAANQTIDITVKGLIDGRLAPQGKVATNHAGKVVLKYHAGEKERRVEIHAKYQPEGYADFIEAQTFVEVEPQKCWEGTVQMIVNQKAEAEKRETRRFKDGAIQSIVHEKFKEFLNYHITVQFYFDQKHKGILLSKGVDGNSQRQYNLKNETFGRCRKGEAWRVVDRSIQESSEETHLIDNITKISVSVDSNPGFSVFTLGLEPQSILVHQTAISYPNWKERQWICTDRTERNPPQEISMELPLGIPFAFSEKKDYETNVFAGEKTIKHEGSFSGVILRNVPEPIEVRYIWSVWRAKCRK